MVHEIYQLKHDLHGIFIEENFYKNCWIIFLSKLRCKVRQKSQGKVTNHNLMFWIYIFYLFDIGYPPIKHFDCSSLCHGLYFRRWNVVSFSQYSVGGMLAIRLCRKKAYGLALIMSISKKLGPLLKIPAQYMAFTTGKSLSVRHLEGSWLK